ncbi:MAG: hypothetical protein AB7P69_15820 [Candidatus Binatia bacterium]
MGGRRMAGPAGPFSTDETEVAASLDVPSTTSQHAVATMDGSGPFLRLLVHDRWLNPIHAHPGGWIFLLPPDTSSVELVSSVALPDVAPGEEDIPHAGVLVSRIILRSPGGVHDVPLDWPALVLGWDAVEWRGPTMLRWMTGAATLPLPRLPEAALLEIRLADAVDLATGSGIDVACPLKESAHSQRHGDIPRAVGQSTPGSHMQVGTLFGVDEREREDPLRAIVGIVTWGFIAAVFWLTIMLLWWYVW